MAQKVGQKVWEITVNKVVNAKTDFHKNGVTIKEFKIIGISDVKICINDRYFTNFDFLTKTEPDRDSWKTYLNDVRVKVQTKEDYFGSGIFTTTHSTRKPSKAILKRIVKEACLVIEKDHEFSLNGFKTELTSCIENYTIKN